MKSNIKIVLTLLTLAILWGCECPVDTDTDKIIVPTEFANILFLNAMPDEDMNELYVFSSSNYIKDIDTISFAWSNIVKDYKKVGIKVAGKKNSVKMVRLADTNNLTDNILYNSLLDITKDSNYTFVAYGLNRNIQSIIKSDYIKDYKEDNIYLRCYHVVADAPDLYFNLTTEGYNNTFTLKSGTASELSALPIGEYTIKVTSVDSAFKAIYPNINFRQGMMNNFVLKGIYKGREIQYGIASAAFNQASN